MTIAVIGAGMIGSALVRSLVQSKYEGKVIVTDVRPERLSELEMLGVRTASDNKKAASEADAVILCVKPGDVRKVLAEIKNEVTSKLVISFAAAIKIDLLKKTVPDAQIVRVMPNIAILVQQSFTACSADPTVAPENKAKTEEILSRLGRFVWVEEEYMDAITGLSGCAPAYLSIILEALTYAGLQTGLPGDIALVAAAQSMVGTGKLVLEAEKQPAAIRDMVTTPGGVTIEGLRALEKIPIRHAFMKAIEAATAKSRKISEDLAES